METKNNTIRKNKKASVFASACEAIQVKQPFFTTSPLANKAENLTWIASLRSQRRVAGFTLVELIVVITILVILGTIAFLNLGNFSSGARDSGRISDLTNISKGLDLLYIKNGVVLPPESGTNAGVVNLYASWILIGQQWAIGTAILSAIKMGGDGKDPIDKKSYTYLVNADKTKYQVLALLEDSTTITSFVPSTYADYTARYPTTKGASLGVLLGNTGATLNQPIQENYSTSTFTGVELFTATGGLYNAVLSSKSIISGTGTAIWAMVANLDTSAGMYPGCDTPNIRLPNGQVWAACNVGASKAYAGQSITNCGNSATDCDASIRYTLGSYFQWGRNKDVTTGTITTWPVWSDITSDFIKNALAGVSPGANYDWLTDATRNDNFWGWSGSTTTTGTYLSQWSPTSMQWPCATGYHIPTQKEWCSMILGIDPSISACSSTYAGTITTITTLKLPLAGLRDNATGNYNFQGTVGGYWTSSPNNFFGSAINFSTTQVASQVNNFRSLGFSIRCMKN